MQHSKRNPFKRMWGLYLLLLLVLGSCTDSTQSQVVVYTSVDQHYSEPVLAHFEQTTGIRVLALYDVEAAKTTGIVNRLLAEKAHPQADVFWNSEFAQTLVLKGLDVLEQYQPAAAADIPAQYCDPEHFWHGTAARARVFIINTEHVEHADFPTSLDAFLEERWPADKIALAMPLFGTTATHAAALYAAWGPEATLAFFTNIKERGIRIEAGNSVVRDRVASGDAWWGLTDTDDAVAAIERGAPVAMVFPGQQQDGLGTLYIPSTVAMVTGAPNPHEAQLLVEYLLSADTEQLLVDSGWCHVPLQAACDPASLLQGTAIHGMDVPLADVYKYMEQALDELKAVFVQ